jgi:hypothetical protein
MKRLPSDARRLLDAARSAAEPSAAQRARADATTRAQLAQHGMVDLPRLSPAPVHAGQGIGSLALKLGAGALVIASAVIALQRLQPDDAPAPPKEGLPVQAAPSAPSAPAAAVAPEPVAEPAPKSQPKSSHGARAGTTAPDHALRAELRLIADANELLQGARFDEALVVLARHGRLFPHGLLSAEREGLRVLSLCGLGASERTLRARERYLRMTPQSPLAARVRAACASAAELR